MTFAKKRKKESVVPAHDVTYRHTCDMFVYLTTTLTLVLSCPQQMTSAAIILIVGKMKIQERRKQSKRGAQVSFLCLIFTFMAFPVESKYNEGKGLMILVTLHTKPPQAWR